MSRPKHHPSNGYHIRNDADDSLIHRSPAIVRSVKHHVLTIDVHIGATRRGKLVVTALKERFRGAGVWSGNRCRRGVAKRVVASEKQFDEKNSMYVEPDALDL